MNQPGVGLAYWHGKECVAGFDGVPSGSICVNLCHLWLTALKQWFMCPPFGKDCGQPGFHII